MKQGIETLVALSGGVDSSVAALRLLGDGQRIAGLFMDNWQDDGDGPCRSHEDRREAVAVCGRLGIPFHVRDFSMEYRDRVFARFLDEYRAGRTPNPDVLCNRELKFGTLLEEARALGADYLATGHYARLDRGPRGWRLLRGIDRAKDQSYFLHQLDQHQLGHARFPIGDLRKEEVRRIAAEAALPTATRKDSTGICFIGERRFREFLSRYLPATEGEIRDVDGLPLGRHPGACYFTLGQREGLALGGIRGRAAAPWYVVAKDVRENILYVDQDRDSRYLQAMQLWAGSCTWVDGDPPRQRFECTAQTRYRQGDDPCEVRVLEDGGLSVRFARAQRAPTPGQSVVFYRGEECLGGAVIERSDAPSIPAAVMEVS